MKRAQRWVFRASFIIAALLLSTIALFLWPASMPSYDEVLASHTGSELALLDRHGEIIQEQRRDANSRRLDWVRLEDISPALTSAIVQAEDRRFYEHHGVDWKSIAGALTGLLRFQLRGASTITMQLAARLDDEAQPSGQRRTIWQKWLQLRGARALEKKWTKPRILEAYLNLVTFRGELQGVAAAAGGLFGKQPHGLTDAESVILASLVRAPNAGAVQVAKRACALAAAMNLSPAAAEISARAAEVLSRPYFIRPQAALAPQALRLLVRMTAGRSKEAQRLASTLDRDLQQAATDILLRHLETVRAQNVRDGAVLALDNRTGEVLAYVGNAGDQGSARYVDGIQALRQAGSTLKPFIYAEAFDRRLLTAASLLDDSPLDVAAPGGIYRPANYDKMFHGLVTARVALASSLNVPAVKALNLVGIDAGLKMLGAAGFTSLRPDDFYGSSLALGAADVTLWELANAYRALANGGRWSPLRMTPDDPPGAVRQVWSPEAAFIVADILNDRESRSKTFSLESPLSTRFWTAVKTGTSKDMRDNWCVGFSDRYTVGVWVGNFSGAPMWNVSGITGAAPVWVEIMNWLHRRSSSAPPKAPPGVVAEAAEGGSGREWFMRGTVQAVAPGEANPGARIVYPVSGTVIALDPDIPAEEQKLFFSAEPGDAALRWVLDGRPVGDAGALHLWTPVRGKHVLSLVGASGKPLDSITFEVRGSIF